jgi:hypothetical protein
MSAVATVGWRGRAAQEARDAGPTASISGGVLREPGAQKGDRRPPQHLLGLKQVVQEIGPATWAPTVERKTSLPCRAARSPSHGARGGCVLKAGAPDRGLGGVMRRRRCRRKRPVRGASPMSATDTSQLYPPGFACPSRTRRGPSARRATPYGRQRHNCR